MIIVDVKDINPLLDVDGELFGGEFLRVVACAFGDHGCASRLIGAAIRPCLNGKCGAGAGKIDGCCADAADQAIGRAGERRRKVRVK